MAVRWVMNGVTTVMYAPELSCTLVAEQTPSHMSVNHALHCSPPSQLWAYQKGQSRLVFLLRIRGRCREERVCMLI
jgi:hypothetical protein